MSGFFWRLLPAVRPGERQRFLFFASLSALIVLAQTLGLTGSEALFLAKVGPKSLPTAFILASLLAVAGSLAYAMLVGRTRNDRLFIAMLLGTAVVLALTTGGLDSRGVLFGLFSAFFLTQAVFLVHFRTFATDFFDTLAAKRLFPGFAVGASLGGAVGGALAVGLSQVAPPPALIAGWAAGLAAAALLLRLGRRNLRRWGPIGLAEADESSVEGLQGGLRFLRRSPLSRWLVISVVGMVLSLSILHYLSSQIFVDSFPSAAELAFFFGVYLTVTNVLEIAVALSITPWLIRRFGVAQSNLAHPVLTLMTFGALAIDPVLAVAVVARANREMIENALAGEVRNLTYNALPFRFRGNLRALLDGIVFYAAMSIAGLAILLVGADVSRLWLCAVGAGAALLYLGANWRVRAEYLRSLVVELRQGRLDLDELEAGLGAGEVSRLAEQWETGLRQETEHPSRASLELAPLLAERGHLAPLRRAATHPHPRVRRACLEALAEHEDPSLSDLLARALRDPEASVRLAAARAAKRFATPPQPLAERLRERLGDEEPAVRAEAALLVGEDGTRVLLEMGGDARPEVAVPALERLPAPLTECARTRLDDSDAGVRAAALLCVSRSDGEPGLSLEHLERELEHG
ncbi:MAG: HEAT repeat domain-containing protein, partial [Proteobacteria bacterium]|nr:HEAT repeat domain-containing protein [Pseudomonadota bacterium]